MIIGLSKTYLVQNGYGGLRYGPYRNEGDFDRRKEIDVYKIDQAVKNGFSVVRICI